MFVVAKGGGEGIGRTKRRKGVRIMTIVGRHGLPLSVSTHAANHHEVTLVQLSFDFYMIEAKPNNLIGDRAYDSDKLDEELRASSIEMIAPHKCNRKKRKTQNSGEIFCMDAMAKTFVDTMGVLRPEFFGFVQLAAMLILIRQF